MFAALLILTALAAAAYAVRRRLAALEADKRALAEALQTLVGRQEALEAELARTRAGQAVLLQALLERGVADEDDLADIRRRVVELPVREAEALEALQQTGRDEDEVVLVAGGGGKDTVH